MAYLDQIALSRDQNFINRVEIAMLTSAQNVQSEVSSAPNHANRTALAKAILNAPQAYLDAFVLGIVANPVVSSQSSDSDLQFTSNSIFNGIAGVS